MPYTGAPIVVCMYIHIYVYIYIYIYIYEGMPFRAVCNVAG